MSDKDLDWLNRFSEEYIACNFTHKGKRIHKKLMIKSPAKRKVRKTGRIKMVDKYKNKSETANNKRNNDIFTTGRASNNVSLFSELTQEPSSNEWEEMILDKLDNDIKEI